MNHEQHTGFLIQNQLDRFIRITRMDDTCPSDTERMALFFLISCNECLFQNLHRIYNFSKHQLADRPWQQSYLPSSSKALLALGINLYNGQCMDNADALHIFRNLDRGNIELAIRAIRIRFMNDTIFS